MDVQIHRNVFRSSKVRCGIIPAFALCSALVACNDRGATNPATLSERVSVQENRDDELQSFARALAIALDDDRFRRQFFRQLQNSRRPEHKSTVSEVLAVAGDGEEEFRRTLLVAGESLIEGRGRTFEVYVPVREHRRTWRGDRSYLVALESSAGGIIAFDGTGQVMTLDRHAAPERPVIAVLPTEMSFRQMENDQSAGLLSSAELQTESILPECGETIEECDGGGGGGGGGGGIPGGSPPAGIYMTQMTIWNKAEPWIRGNPEIEVVILGTVQGRYYATPFSPGFPAVLQFQAGNFVVPIGCAGRVAPLDFGGLKRFDFNGENGAEYNQNVLLEAAVGFAVTEKAEGPYGAVLFSRDVAVQPPYYVQVWERDDGGECPTPATPWFPSFSVGFRFNTLPGGSISGFAPTGTASDWSDFFGITNENDSMGAWTFSDWASVGSINQSVLLSGSHVSIRISNTGVTSSSIPQL